MDVPKELYRWRYKPSVDYSQTTQQDRHRRVSVQGSIASAADHKKSGQSLIEVHPEMH